MRQQFTKHCIITIYLGLTFSLGTVAWGGPLETWHLFWAQHYMQQKQYSKARQHYEKLTNPSDTVHYNLGNLLYRQKHYTEAISQYMQIQTASLMHQRYHNIGNCLIALGEVRSAARFYRNALKFAKHPSTLANLNRTLSLLKKQEEQEEEMKRKESSETREFRDGSSMIDRYKEDNGTALLKDAKRAKIIVKKVNTVVSRETDEGGKIETVLQKDRNGSLPQAKGGTFDRYEARHWEYFFKKKPLKTLLIPLETKGKSYDQNPY